MAKKTIRDLTAAQIRGKRVLVRFDLNVSTDDAGNITGDRRIFAAKPTLDYLIAAGARVIVMSHLGRPDPAGALESNRPFQLDRVADRLREICGAPVQKVDQLVGDKALAAVQSLKDAHVLVLENVRFHAGEQHRDESKKQELAAEIAKYGDVYVNDAFGTLHNKDVSVLALPAAMKDRPRVIGLLVEKELAIVDQILSAPKRPLIGIMGGAKVSDKIKFIRVLVQKVDRLLIGGAMSYTFMKAAGQGVGSSKVEGIVENKDGTKTDVQALARELLAEHADKIVLPFDHVAADRFAEDAATQVVKGAIPEGLMGLDIGPRTCHEYSAVIASAGTVIWNGPMGKFEWERFAKGTRSVADAMSVSKGTTVIGGGETAEAVEAMGLAEQMTHVSTGGGAFLKYVEERKFKTLDQIEDR
jgi:phosphoglycerate kinase